MAKSKWRSRRCVRAVERVFKTANVERKSWKQDMYRFLRNFRATPHTTARVPPPPLHLCSVRQWRSSYQSLAKANKNQRSKRMIATQTRKGEGEELCRREDICEGSPILYQAYRRLLWWIIPSFGVPPYRWRNEYAIAECVKSFGETGSQRYSKGMR